MFSDYPAASYVFVVFPSFLSFLMCSIQDCVLDGSFSAKYKKLYKEHKIGCLPDRPLACESDIYSVDLVNLFI